MPRVNNTPGEISGARASVAQMEKQLGGEIEENAKLLRSVIKDIDRAQKNMKAGTKNYEKLSKLKQEINKQEEISKRLSEDEASNIKDLIETNKDLKDLYVDMAAELAKIAVSEKKAQKDKSKDYEKELDHLEKVAAKKSANAKLEKRFNKEVATQQEQDVKIASDNMFKAVAGAVDKIADSATRALNAINLDKLANGGAEMSKTWKIMDDSMKAFNLNAKEFNNYKNSIIDDMTSMGGTGKFESIFGGADITQTLDQLASMGIQDQKQAKELASTIAYGNKYLGMSAETQEAMYKLQRKNGLEGLIEKQTATTAKLLKSGINVAQDTLDAINKTAVDQTEALGMLGASSEKQKEYAAEYLETGAKLSAAYTNGEAAQKEIMDKLLSEDDDRFAVFGNNFDNMLNKLVNDKDYNSLDVIKEWSENLGDSVGTIAEEYFAAIDSGRTSEAQIIAKEFKEQTGMSQSVLGFLKELKDKGWDSFDKATEQVNEQDKILAKDAKGDPKKMLEFYAQQTADSLTASELIQNEASAWVLKFDWNDIRTIASWGSFLVIGLNAISSVLNIISEFKGAKWFSKLSKGFKNFTKSLWGKMKDLGSTIKDVFSKGFGKIKDVFGKGITKFLGAGTKLGGSLGIGGGSAETALGALKSGKGLSGAAQVLKNGGGLSKQLLGNGTLAKAGGIGGALWVAADAVGGATKMADELYGYTDENGKKVKPTVGQRVASGLAGAVAGTKVNNKDNAYNGITGKAMEKLGVSKDTAATVKNVAGGAMSGAAKGALIGSAIPVPVVGTAAGAIVGGVAGLIGGIFKDKKRKEKEKREEEERKRQLELLKKQLETEKKIAAATQITAKNTEAGYSERIAYYTSNAYAAGGPTVSAGSSLVNGPAGGTFRGLDTGVYSKTSDYISKEEAERTGGRVVTSGGKVISSGAHSGIDFGAPSGTPIGSASAGKVTFADWSNNGGGFQTHIMGTDGLEYWYLHQVQKPPVSVGQQVEQGDTIGYVGSTGNSSGPHLHFSVRRNGQYIDPAPYVNTSVFTAKPGGVGIKQKVKSTLKNYGPETRKMELDGSTISANAGGIYDDSRVVSGLSEIKQTLLDLAANQNEQQKMIDALSRKPIGNVSY